MSSEQQPPRRPPRRNWSAVILIALLALVLGGLIYTRPHESVRAAGLEQITDAGQLRLMAPADPGGGWDQTARAMQSALVPIIGRSEVYNVGGAGGTIGLAQFQQMSGRPNELMVMGAIMVGAIETNESRYGLDDVTPIARLLTEYQVIVVPESSPITSVEDLRDALRADVGAVSFAGGSAGGVEQVLAGELAQAVGANPAQVSYVAHSGGGESLSTVLSGRASAGLSGVSEIKPYIDSGDVRALAVSAPERVANLPDVPTLRERGIDVEVQNWRGVAAPSGLTPEQRDAATRLIREMSETAEWRTLLDERGWRPAYLDGPAFVEFVRGDVDQTRDTLRQIGLIS
ncbi:Bug family tripartite tricarboxylate transporter substrate binding protein [Mycolicibacterium vaccae]|uniref:Bug family tripartite tricarboxylate transporter substrate binding protein n=1 Tax=Mycolicibacterium vaccae TaxID=1810 RepID=UPI003D027FF5